MRIARREMIKMRKLNRSGFVLVETLVVSVFVMVILSIMYTNFYPLMGEYEKREVYDDIDGKYAAYWFKRIIQSDSFSFTAAMNNAIANQKYYQFRCSDISDLSSQNLCNSLITKFNVSTDGGTPHIYLITYNTEEFKSVVEENEGEKFSGGLQDYMVFLPKYLIPSLNDASYRIVIEFHRTKDGNDYLAYSTIEVKK